jgi:hypothetical protein
MAWVQLEWVTPPDNFDNIISASRSALRVFLMSNWAVLQFSSLDIIGVDVEPGENNSAQNFIFFFFLSILALTISILFMAAIYYHFFIAATMWGRKQIFGERDSIWIMYEERLLNVEHEVQGVMVGKREAVAAIRDSASPDNEGEGAETTEVGVEMTNRTEDNDVEGNARPEESRSPSGTVSASPAEGTRGHRGIRFADVFETWWYQALAIGAVCIPVVLLLGYRSISYSNLYMVPLDCILTLGYIGEYYMRVGILGTEYLYTTCGQQETVVIGVLKGVVAFQGWAYLTGAWEIRYALLSTNVTVLIRVYRIAVVFPQLGHFVRIIILSMSGFIPTFLYLLFVIFFFGVVGTVTLGDVPIDYGNEFLNSHYNFKTFFGSFILLTSVGTGNVWTEILKGMNSPSLATRIYIETFFALFYLSFFTIMKSFAIMIISKYVTYSGTCLGVADQQIRNFQKTWNKFGYHNHITFMELLSFIEELNAPLGLKGNPDKTYIFNERFCRAVILCMPSDAKQLDDFDPTKSREVRVIA